jgi:hypothetical protein
MPTVVSDHRLCLQHYRFGGRVGTVFMNVCSAASEQKFVARPDVICSTRPCTLWGVSAVLSRSCTTTDQCGESGAIDSIVWLMADSSSVGR